MKNSAKHALLLAIQVLLLFALMALLLAIANRHNRRIDLTPEREYSLSPQSRQVAQRLPERVRITVFYNSQEHGRRREIFDLLDQFRQTSSRIDFRLLDLDRSPGLAKKYGVTHYNSGVLESGGRTLLLPLVNETEIVRVLLTLLRRTEKILYFLTGHGEHDPFDIDEREGYSQVAKDLEQENYVIRRLDFVPGNGVPEDCTVLIMGGPKENLHPFEVENLARYLDRGGRVILLVDPDGSPGLTDFLRRYGVELGNNVIVDERNRLFGADSYMARIPIFDQAVFRQRLDVAAVFPVARTVDILPLSDRAQEEKMTPHPSLLAFSSPESWADLNGAVGTDKEPRFRRGIDKGGPLPVGVLVAITSRDDEHQPATEGRLVVFGDADFPSNFYLHLMGNKDVIMSSIALLAEEEELIALRQKERPRGTLSPLYLTAAQGRLIFWVVVIALPLGALTIGLGVWAAKRRWRG